MADDGEFQDDQRQRHGIQRYFDQVGQQLEKDRAQNAGIKQGDHDPVQGLARLYVDKIVSRAAQLQNSPAHQDGREQDQPEYQPCQNHAAIAAGDVIQNSQIDVRGIGHPSPQEQAIIV